MASDVDLASRHVQTMTLERLMCKRHVECAKNQAIANRRAAIRSISKRRAMRALICGIGGQDGAYLARFLLNKGYEVFGTSRDAQLSAFANLDAVGVSDRVTLCSMSLVDFRSVLSVIAKVRPDEIYNLSGQSSVGLSFDQPVETFESVAVATVNLLEVIRFLDRAVRLYNAGSGECFGNVGARPRE